VFQKADIYRNISNILSELDVGIYSGRGDWTDEDYRPFLCEMEVGFFEYLTLLLWLGRGDQFLIYK
jgi:hypothetical protein